MVSRKGTVPAHPLFIERTSPFFSGPGRKTILLGARILEPRFIIGGWSVANLVYANGTADPPTNKDQFTNLDEYGRPNPDGGRFPSAIVGGGDGE